MLQYYYSTPTNFLNTVYIIDSLLRQEKCSANKRITFRYVKRKKTRNEMKKKGDSPITSKVNHSCLFCFTPYFYIRDLRCRVNYITHRCPSS